MSTEYFKYTDGSRLIESTATWLVKQTVWEANRTLDLNHVTDLEATIQNKTEIQGPFTVISYPDETTGQPMLRIVDGQHRQEVLRRYFAADPTTTDFSILVRHYQIASHDDAVRIFAQINHAKPMVYRGSVTERLHAIVTALKREFIADGPHGRLVSLVRPACNRPFLNTEHLEAALNLYEVHEREDLTPADVVNHARLMNGWYAADHNRVGAKYTQGILDNAVRYKFYLGLDPKCQWLIGLKQSPSNTV